MHSVGEQPFYFFQKRNERLDWRKIASMDLEKLVHEGETGELLEYMSPILFCRAEAEFDPDKTDPGFIKVFKLSQLIGQYLSHSHSQEKTKGERLMVSYSGVIEERDKVKEEVQALRESLASNKKELKRAKELLASAQTKALGSDNQDEIDQCPYCNKRFLTPFYLHAHIQRRHQGLPLPPFTVPSVPSLFSLQQPPTNFSPGKVTPAVYTFTMSPNGTVSQQHLSPEKAKVQDCSTQTNQEILLANPITPNPTTSEGEIVTIRENGNDLVKVDKERLDLQGICELVEEYLEQKKSVASQNQVYDQIVHSIYAGTNNIREADPMTTSQVVVPVPLTNNESVSTREDIERIEGHVMRMKDEFESQWTNLSQKIRESGIEELRDSFLTEIKKVQEMILNTPRKEQKEESVSSQSQEKEIQMEKVAEGPKAPSNVDVDEKLSKLENGLETKMQQELEELRMRLEKQEYFWRSQLQTIEEKHESQIEKLQKDVEEKEKEKQRNNEKNIVPHPIPMLPPLTLQVPEKDEISERSEVVSSSAPVAKPRKNFIKEIHPISGSDSEPEYLTIFHAQGDAKQIQIHNEPLPALKRKEEDQVSEYTLSSSSFGEEDENVGGRGPTSPGSKYVFDSSKGKLVGVGETRSGMELVRDRVVLKELEDKVEELGISPQANIIGMEEMARALKHLKADRRSVEPPITPDVFHAQLEGLRKDVKYEVSKRSIHQKLEEFDGEGGSVGSGKKGTPSPFSKIIKKMKSSGNNWKQKVSSAMKRKPKENETKEEELKTTFFSKWGRKKKLRETNNEMPVTPSAPEGEESDETSSSSRLEMPPYMTRSQPLLLHRRDSSSQRGKVRRKNSNSVQETPKSSKRAPPPEEVEVESSDTSIWEEQGWETEEEEVVRPPLSSSSSSLSMERQRLAKPRTRTVKSVTDKRDLKGHDISPFMVEEKVVERPKTAGKKKTATNSWDSD